MFNTKTFKKLFKIAQMDNANLEGYFSHFFHLFNSDILIQLIVNLQGYSTFIKC